MSRYGNQIKFIRLLFIKLVLTLFLMSILWVLVYKWFSPPATLLMMQRRAAPAQNSKTASEKIRYDFVELEDVSYHVPLAFIASEDQLFTHHNGFDYNAIHKAFQKNQKGRRVVGGSTISQQVAKNVFLWHGRSYIRKVVEAYFTILIELFWSKHRIMEMYLNIAEMGNKVFGIEQAAQKYFNKPAKDLNAYEAAAIAAVLPNPIKFSVTNPSGYIVRKRAKIRRNMRNLGGKMFIKPLVDNEI
ncbi:monofunctional biosynthetic peptidoglycan transglycosylase [Adhaeribacter terreus]|uniref:Biosynthetic peptidoglycan transglycosylase n=1 Tax=Adhaeribacter terreus TaxID=529703 RepID=A0ABW0EAH8_9BACT